jgi:hypothetical protein
MAKKKSIKRASPNQRKNLLEKVSSRAKNNVLVVAIILITSGIIYFREILSSFNYLKKEILDVYSTYISDKVVDQDNELRYLVFNGKQNFELWHKEVIKLLGLPKHARTYSNDEILKDVKVSEYTRMIMHPNPHDKRVMCVFDSDVPQILINEDAEIQYNFIKASHLALEDMGFFFDDLTIQFDHEYLVKIPEIEEINKDYKYFEPKNLKSRKKLNELNFLALLELRKNNTNRNSYIMKYGPSLNKNKIK